MFLNSRQTCFAAAIALVTIMCAPALSLADEALCSDDAMLVFDASVSMTNLTEGGPTRIEQARIAAHQVVPAAAKRRNLGLMTYGPGGANQCGNISLKVPPRPDAANDILLEIDAIDTAGETPLSSAVEAAAVALDYRNRPAVIVLLTDGDENCGRDPCEIARALAANAKHLTIHVIGFMLGSRPRFHAACFAEETGGLYVPANSIEELTDALSQTLVCPQITQAGHAQRRRRVE